MQMVRSSGKTHRVDFFSAAARARADDMTKNYFLY
jgi:hypothetical protein